MKKINIDIVFSTINKATAGIDQLTTRLGRVNTCMWKMNQMSDLWGKMAQTMENLSAPGIALEKSVAELSAITGIAGDELKGLEKTARQVGKTSGLGATGAVEAYKLLASQIDVSKIGIEGLNDLQKNTITLAQASGMQLGAAADSLAGTINQFGLEADQANRVINVLAAGSKYGAAEIPQLAQSFKVVGSAAAAAGLSVEATGGAIETLSKANLKGSEAGTALRNILLKMQTELGFDFKVTKLSDALKTLEGKEGDAAYMAKIFGAENMAAAQFLVKNSDLVDEMTGRMTGTVVATEQAAINTNTFAHRSEVLKAKLNDLSISFFNNNKGLVQMVEMGGKGAQMLTSLAPIGSFVSGGLGMVFKGAKGAVSGIKEVAKASKLMKAAAAAGKMDTYAALINRYGAAGKVAALGLKVQTLAQGAWNAVAGFTTGTMVPLIAKTWAWTAALLANPITWVVVGVGALIAGLALAWKHFDGFRGAVVGAWEGIKQFGVILWQSIINPIKQILSGLGAIGKAIGLALKGKFGEAATAAKEGFADVVQGAVKATPAGVALEVVSRRKEIVDKAAAGYEKGKAIDTGSKKTKDKRPKTEDYQPGQAAMNFSASLPNQGLSGDNPLLTPEQRKAKEAEVQKKFDAINMRRAMVLEEKPAAQPSMKVVKSPGMVDPLSGPANMAINQPAVPGMNIPATIDAQQPTAKPMAIPGTVTAGQPSMKVVKAPGVVDPLQVPQPAGVNVPGNLAMNRPSVPGMNIPGTIEASQPTMKVVKAAGMIYPIQVPPLNPIKGTLQATPKVAGLPSVPGMTIPGMIDAKQPEAKPMTIPGIVSITTPKIEALNISGDRKTETGDRNARTSNIEALTRNITTNISKNEIKNQTANQTNNDSTAKIEVTYSPVINISSAMDQRATDELMKMLADNKDELMKLINEEMRRNNRLRYAG